MNTVYFSFSVTSTHLELCDPGAVPVRHVGPLDEELPLRPPCQRGGIGGVGCKVWRARDRCGGRSIAPPPRQDLLDLPLHGWTLQGHQRIIRTFSVFRFQLTPSKELK